MRETSYEDAAAIGRQLNVNKDEVWKIVKGLKYSTIPELCMIVHDAFRRGSTVTFRGAPIDSATTPGRRI
jgi:hypothetical protein